MWCCVVTVIALAAWAPNVYAFGGFDDGGGGGLSDCAFCHPDLAGSSHDAHAALSNNDCDSCHAGGAGFNNPPLANCVRCHGRDADAGGDDISAGLGRGERQHHQGAGVLCGNCHGDATGPAGVGENVLPSFYPSALGGAGLDPCNGSEEQFSSVTVSLDNDGDGQTDGADPDCPTTTTTPTTSTTTTTLVGVPIGGKNLLIKNKLPDEEQKNKVKVVAKDANVVAGDIGSAADPRCTADGGGGGGGALTVSSATSGQTFTAILPCENWKRIGKDPGAGNAPKGYKYIDRKLESGACKSVVIKRGKQVKVLCLGKGSANLDYDLEVGQAQDPVDVTLRTGPQVHCVQFGGKINKDGTNGKIFKATKAPGLTSCP